MDGHNQVLSPHHTLSADQCHQLMKVEPAILPKMGSNRHTPKVVLYGTKIYGDKKIMNIHTEQTIMHTEIFIARLRGEDEISTLQMILLNKQQLVTGAKDFLSQSPYSRYPYCELDDVTFLCRAYLTCTLN